MISYNKLILEPYKGTKKIKTTINSGFASIQQRTTMVGLKILKDAIVVVGSETINIKKGGIAYICEELLATQLFGKKTYNIEKSNEEFIVVDFHYVTMVEGI